MKNLWALLKQASSFYADGLEICKRMLQASFKGLYMPPTRDFPSNQQKSAFILLNAAKYKFIVIGMGIVERSIED